jgi:hypothetical protein
MEQPADDDQKGGGDEQRLRHAKAENQKDDSEDQHGTDDGRAFLSMRIGFHKLAPIHAMGAFFKRAQWQYLLLLGDHYDSAHAKSRGSPFQMPARLADGLGLESGLETGCPVSFAPSELLRILGLPRPAPGRKPDFGCN